MTRISKVEITEVDPGVWYADPVEFPGVFGDADTPTEAIRDMLIAVRDWRTLGSIQR